MVAVFKTMARQRLVRYAAMVAVLVPVTLLGACADNPPPPPPPPPQSPPPPPPPPHPRRRLLRYPRHAAKLGRPASAGLSPSQLTNCPALKFRAGQFVYGGAHLKAVKLFWFLQAVRRLFFKKERLFSPAPAARFQDF